MTRRIAIIQGHPDPAGYHLLHALADTCVEGAAAAGHEVRSIDVAKLEFPLLRTQGEFESGALPPALVRPRGDMRWSDHWVFLFPLWYGTMPAVLKGFLEHIFPARLCLRIPEGRVPAATACRPLGAHRCDDGNAGPALALVFRRLRPAKLRAQVLRFAGIKPIRESLYWLRVWRRKEMRALDRGNAQERRTRRLM